MGTLHSLRDIAANAHYTRAKALNKTVSLLNAAEVVLYEGLYAVVRGLTKKEREIHVGLMASEIDLVIEIARQGTFTGLLSGNVLEPHHVKVKHGNYIYEVVSPVLYDDTSPVGDSGVVEPAVVTLFVKRMGVGLGELPR
jgi:hypothetical protein